MVQIREAETARMVSSARDLIKEYSASLGIDLSFQDFEKEMVEFPAHYTKPDGRVFVAVEGSIAVGVVGVRRFSGKVCELKRMYVRPEFRGKGIGRMLAEKAIREAREIGYDRMRLDTLSRLEEAVSLYRSLGFKEIAPYRANPNKGVVYMELELGASPPPRTSV